MKTVDSVYQVKLIRQQYYSLGFPLIFFTSNYIEVHCILKFTVQYIEVPLYVLVVQTCFSSSLYSGTSSNLPDSEMICAPPLPPPFAPLKDQKKDWRERLSIRQSVKKKKKKWEKDFSSKILRNVTSIFDTVLLGVGGGGGGEGRGRRRRRWDDLSHFSPPPPLPSNHESGKKGSFRIISCPFFICQNEVNNLLP